MRFRKSIGLFNGVRMNVSKSGVSLTMGRKGVSANVGKDGVFLNTSLPGTGLYDRRKLVDFKGAGTKQKPSPASRTDPAVEAELARAENLTDAFVNIGAQACDLPRDWSEQALALPPSDEAVEAAIGDWLSRLSLPIDFNVSYEYENGVLLADMDLPEIEHLPTVKARQLASGQIKEAAKSQKELKAEYARCVFGLGMFCASYFFCVTPHMEKILLSAYTQRRNADGDISDDYIYSVAIPREGLESRVIEDPEAVFLEFPNRLRLSATKVFSVVKPFAPADREALEKRLEG